MMCLADTNILSELARPQPNAGVVAWAQGVQRIEVSAITVDEIYFGLAWKPNQRIHVWFEEFFTRHCHVLPVSHDVARRSGKLRGQLVAQGIQRTQADMMIAATADVHRLTLVTRNERDFAGCAIPILNPFQ